MQKLTAATVFAELQGKEIALIGLGVSHRPVAKLLAQKGMKVTIYDKKSPEELGEAAKELTAMGVAFVTGADYLQKLRGDVIFRTPGMYFNHPRLKELMKAGAAVTSELELFMQCCPCPIIGVTGSDGKTTTTSLIAEMLRQSGNAVEPVDESSLLSLGAVGDVCHRFFDADGNLVRGQLDDRVVGISPADYRGIPRRVGLAGGARKHAAIRAALRGGWVNVLLTDVETARTLLS